MADRFGNLTILDNGASDDSEPDDDDNDNNDDDDDYDYNTNENSDGMFYCGEDIHLFQEGK